MTTPVEASDTIQLESSSLVKVNAEGYIIKKQPDEESVP
jgi:hypothetical protein